MRGVDGRWYLGWGGGGHLPRGCAGGHEVWTGRRHSTSRKSGGPGGSVRGFFICLETAVRRQRQGTEREIGWCQGRGCSEGRGCRRGGRTCRSLFTCLQRAGRRPGHEARQQCWGVACPRHGSEWPSTAAARVLLAASAPDLAA